jgi:uncharacterized membrane protein
MSLDLTVLVFDGLDGAERAFATARERAGDAPWVKELAFVEHHRNGRVALRGTFAGRYVDVEELADVVGREAAIGALTGALVGTIFGPPGFAVGLVGGAALGGYRHSLLTAELRGGLFDEVRHDVPEGSSAVILLAAPDHVDSMLEAFEGLGGRLVRRSLPDDAVAELMQAVAWAPPAALA